MVDSKEAKGKKRKKKTSYVYEVGIQIGEKIDRVEIVATHHEFADMDNLMFFQGEICISEFREWLFYVRLEQLEDEIRPVNPKEFWGYVDGKKF